MLVGVDRALAQNAELFGFSLVFASLTYCHKHHAPAGDKQISCSTALDRIDVMCQRTQQLRRINELSVYKHDLRASTGKLNSTRKQF